MSKKIKELELNNLRATFKGVKDMVLLEPLKLDSATDYDMRKKLREKKIRVKMVKNSLMKKVFDENGVKVDPGSGPTLLVWGADSIKELGTAVDTILKDLKKDPKAPLRLKEKTAVAEGQPVPLDVARTLPTRKEAIGAVIAAMMGPAQAIAGCLVGPANNIAGILKAIEEKVPAAGGEAAAAPAPTDAAPAPAAG
jgi:large subunit ribosomal protein L10